MAHSDSPALNGQVFDVKSGGASAGVLHLMAKRNQCRGREVAARSRLALFTPQAASAPSAHHIEGSR